MALINSIRIISIATMVLLYGATEHVQNCLTHKAFLLSSSNLKVNPSKFDMNIQKEDTYLRLRLRFENQALSIIHAKKVESPLLRESEVNLGVGIIYELRLNKVRLDLRAIPYDGLFVDMAANQNREGFEQVPESFEFHVRIPLVNFKYKDLKQLKIELYYLKNPFSNVLVSEKKIIEQFPNKLIRLAKLSCIQPDTLSKALKIMLQEVFE